MKSMPETDIMQDYLDHANPVKRVVPSPQAYRDLQWGIRSLAEIEELVNKRVKGYYVYADPEK